MQVKYFFENYIRARFYQNRRTNLMQELSSDFHGDSILEFYTLFRCFVSFMHAVNVCAGGKYGYLLFTEFHAEVIRK